MPSDDSSFWSTLEELAHQGPANVQSIWVWLAQKLDLAQSRPQAADCVIVSQLTDRDGPYYILKNPATKTYFRLSDRDHFLWQRMDGNHTVKDMVVAYFMEYKVLAFARVGVLLEGLKSAFLLTEQPVNVYQQVRTQLDRRDPQKRLADLGKILLEKQFPIRGVDRLLTSLYKLGGWLFYTPPAQILWLLVTVAGLVCFSIVMADKGYGIVAIRGNYLLGVISLIAVYILSMFVHEIAHGLTVKHYHREVPRGGLMIYFGFMTFFVDTSDIWMEGKRPRLAVTWAGPYANLILAGAASLAMITWPSFLLNPLLFQFSFITYLNVLLNLNPLLELDGYFLLMDFLEIPMLRRKSLEFIRHGIWAKFKVMRAGGKKVWGWFGEFSREERIFAIFGLLAAIWTVYSVLQAVDVWQRRAASAVSTMFLHSGPAGRIAVTVGVIILGLALLMGVGFMLANLVRRTLNWAAKIGLFATMWRKAAWVLILILLAGSITIWLPILAPLIGLEALTLAVYFAACNARDYRGSRFAVVFQLMAAAGVGFWLSELAGMAGRAFPHGSSWIAPVESGLTGLAFLFLVSAGLVLFFGTNFHSIPLVEKAILVIGCLATLGLMTWLAGKQITAGAPLLSIALAVLSELPLLTIVFLLPTLTAFWHTSTGPAAILIGLGIAALLGVRLFGIPACWAYLFLAGGFGLQQAAFRRRVILHAPQAEIELRQNDPERLKEAFTWMTGGLVEQMIESGGRRQVDVFVRQFNEFAQAADWHIQIVGDRATVEMPSLSLQALGAAYAAALSLLIELMIKHMGERLAIRALQRVYDALPWEVREITALYLFQDVIWAKELGQQFQVTQQTYHSLLQRIPLFAGFSRDEIDHLCSRLHAKRYMPGQVIIRQGDRGDRFYIVSNGSVEVEQRSPQGVVEIVNHLGRGEYFGQVALLNDSPRNSTCRATVPTDLLSLSRQDFDQLVKICFDLRDKVEKSIEKIRLLRQIPLFTDMDAQQLQLIAAHLTEENASPGATIIKQGEVGDKFYIIKSGQVQVIVSSEKGEQPVNERGPGQFVGEMALLLQKPRLATVRAMEPTSLLVLNKADFDQLVATQLYGSKLLEQEMSRRMSGLQRTARS
jgi:putative peptide zinc metalloprotease protein